MPNRPLPGEALPGTVQPGKPATAGGPAGINWVAYQLGPSTQLTTGSVTTDKLADLAVTGPKIADFAISVTKLIAGIIFLTGENWTNNSPSAGSVAWSAHSVVHGGTQYNVAAGSTALKYIYWLKAIPAVYQSSPTFPMLGKDDFLIAVNTGGTLEVMWNQARAQKWIDPRLLDASIGGGNLISNSSFEIDANGDGTPDYWWTYNNGPEGATFVRSAVAPFHGSYHGRVTWAVPNTSTKGVSRNAPTGGFKLDTWYVVSWWAKTSQAFSSGMALYWNNPPQSAEVISNPNLSTGYQRYAYRIKWTTAPDPNLFISIIGAGGQPASDLDIDAVQVEIGDYPTGYAPDLLPGSINTVYLADLAVTTEKVALAAITQALIANLAVGNAQIQDAAITAAKVNDLNAGTLTAGVLNVGGQAGGPKVSKFNVWDLSSNRIGFIGDDTGDSNYVGAWFKRIRGGGTAPSNAPLQTDDVGNMTLNGATITLNKNGIVTTINNDTEQGYPVGLKVTDGANSTYVTVGRLRLYHGDSASIRVEAYIGGDAGYLSVKGGTSNVGVLELISNCQFKSNGHLLADTTGYHNFDDYVASASAGSASLPSNPVGFLVVSRANGGGNIRIPYYWA